MDISHACWFSHLCRWLVKEDVLSWGKLPPISDYSVQAVRVTGSGFLSFKSLWLWKTSNWRRNNFLKKIWSDGSTILSEILLNALSAVKLVTSKTLIGWMGFYLSVGELCCTCTSAAVFTRPSPSNVLYFDLETSHNRYVQVLYFIVGLEVICSRGQAHSPQTDMACCNELRHEQPSALDQHKGGNFVQDDPTIHKHSPGILQVYCSDWYGQGQSGV